MMDAVLAADVNTIDVNARPRFQFRFCLDVSKDEELVLADEFELLKSKRQFKPTVCDAVRLLLDLRNGSTDVLFELFPLLRQQLAAPLPAAPAAQPRPVKTDVKPLDLALEIKRTGNTENNNSSWNFMIASAAQVYGNYDALPPEIIEYGVRTGKIPAEKAPKKMLHKQDKPKNEIGVIAGSNVAFEAPALDDLELEIDFT